MHMENTRIIFIGESLEKDDSELECVANNYGAIYLSITNFDHPNSWLTIDKETAVKLSKELRRQIGKLEKEGNNG